MWELPPKKISKLTNSAVFRSSSPTPLEATHVYLVWLRQIQMWSVINEFFPTNTKASPPRLFNCRWLPAQSAPKLMGWEFDVNVIIIIVVIFNIIPNIINTVATSVPSSLIHRTSGWGIPDAVHGNSTWFKLKLMKRFGKIKYQPDKKSACVLKSNSRKRTTFTFSPSRTSRKSVKWIMKGGSTTDTFKSRYGEFYENKVGDIRWWWWWFVMLMVMAEPATLVWRCPVEIWPSRSNFLHRQQTRLRSTIAPGDDDNIDPIMMIIATWW